MTAKYPRISRNYSRYLWGEAIPFSIPLEGGSDVVFCAKFAFAGGFTKSVLEWTSSGGWWASWAFFSSPFWSPFSKWEERRSWRRQIKMPLELPKSAFLFSYQCWQTWNDERHNFASKNETGKINQIKNLRKIFYLKRSSFLQKRDVSNYLWML